MAGANVIEATSTGTCSSSMFYLVAAARCEAVSSEVRMVDRRRRRLRPDVDPEAPEACDREILLSSGSAAAVAVVSDSASSSNACALVADF